MIDEDFRTYLLGFTDLHVQQNKVDASTDRPFVWFERTAEPEEQEPFLDGTPNQIKTLTYDVEVVSLDIDEAIEEVTTLRAAVHGFRGNWGATRILGAFANDLADDYIPRAVPSDAGFHVAAFRLNVIHK